MLRWIAGTLLILAGLAVVSHGWWSGFEEAGGQRVLAAEAAAAPAAPATPAPAPASGTATATSSGTATTAADAGTSALAGAAAGAGGGSVTASAAAAAAALPVLSPLGHWRPPGPAPQIYASLSIPAIGLSAYVVRGASLTDYYDLLAWGPAHLRGSAEPGSLGNAVIFGHVDEFGSPFRQLDRLRPGDPIDLVQTGSHYTYRVQSVRLVPATDLGIVASRRGVRALTLFTCGGPANSDRVDVYATLAGAQPAVAAGRLG